MTDPIADMLTRIRNAVTAKHTRVDMPASRIKVDIARILQDEGYIQGFKVLDDPHPTTTAPVKTLRLFLKYGPHGERLITGAHTGIDLERLEAQIEQDRAAVLRTQRLRVGPKLGQHGPLAHRGGAIGQAERDALAPRLRRNGLECDEPHVWPRLDADTAARGHRRDGGLGA